MKKRPWLRWVILIILFALVSGGIWLKRHVDEQPQEHEDPGIPDVPDLPDPDDVE
ncbi:hypothetical protein N9195_00455 [bacterium]|nr:hypothetical protein [bacterium]